MDLPYALADESGRVRVVNAALQDEVFNQTADRVIGKSSDNSGAQTEAAAQTAGDIVFTATLPDIESTGGVNSAGAGIKAEHHFAQTDDIISAQRSIFIFQHSKTSFN